MSADAPPMPAAPTRSRHEADLGVAPPRIELEPGDDGRLLVRLAGHWTLTGGAPGTEPVEAAVGGLPADARLVFDSTRIGSWDSLLVAFVLRLRKLATARGAHLDPTGLPEGVQGLLDLVDAVPPRIEAGRHRPDPGFLEVVGQQSLDFVRSAGELVEFFGEVVLSLGRLLRGRARMRVRDLLVLMQQSGAEALPIVSLISVLVGLILAYVGAIQLAQFGAGIFVADLVAIAMAREMAGMMTGIIMAGRTGAAYAAQLGTMTANEEIDALRTAAVPPMDFLVLPRMLALVLMMPLLALYSTLMGIIGGAIIGITLLGLAPMEYLNQTREAVNLLDLASGVFKASVYGVIVAVSSCLRGMQCGRSAAAVGDATTSAVVTSIVFIVVASATLTILFQILGI